jgi:hypothetical protein
MWLAVVVVVAAVFTPLSMACVTSAACGMGGVCIPGVAGYECVCVGPWSVNASSGTCDVPVLSCSGYATVVDDVCVCPRNRQGPPLCALCAPGFTGTQCSARTAVLAAQVAAFFSDPPSPSEPSPTPSPSPSPSQSGAPVIDDRTTAIVDAVVRRVGGALCATSPRGRELVPAAFVVACVGCIVIGGAMGIWLSIWERVPRRGVQMYEKV